MHGQNAGLVSFVDTQQLLHARDFANDDVVAQKDSKRFISNQCLGYENGVPESQRLLLANRRHGDHSGDLLHNFQQLMLPLFLELVLQPVVVIEVVLNRIFTAAGDEGDIF